MKAVLMLHSISRENIYWALKETLSMVYHSLTSYNLTFCENNCFMVSNDLSKNHSNQWWSSQVTVLIFLYCTVPF